MPDGITPVGDLITVVLADDNLIVRTGVRALLDREPDVEVLAEAADAPELLAAAEAHQPQVVVSDIRMPPTFQREGIDCAKEIRKRNPGTGVVILSQYADPEYAISLLADGAAGYAYLLKDRLAEGDQLVDAIRAVATGGTLLDPVIVDALVTPGRGGRGPQRRRPGAADLRRRGSADQGHRRGARHHARGGGRRRASTCSWRWPRARRRATTARCDACACCTRPSWTARSRARPSPACCPAGWRRSCAARAGTSASPRRWRSPC